MAENVTGDLYYEIDGQLAEIKRQLRQKSGYPYNTNYLRVALQRVIEGEFGGIVKNPTFLINPIYNLKEGIEKGNYDWVYNFIQKKKNPKIFDIQNARADKPEEVEVELIHFGRSISTKDAIKELKAQGYRPATPAELLGFGAKYPEEQKKYPIVALPTQEEIDNDSVFRHGSGHGGALCLGWDSGERRLDLRWLEDDWHDYRRFLAVRLPEQSGK